MTGASATAEPVGNTAPVPYTPAEPTVGAVEASSTALQSPIDGVDPVVLGVGAGGALVVLVVVWRVLRWLRRPEGARFRSALERVDEVSVLMHPNPDPDAMSCAVAVGELAEQVGTDAALQYPGQVRHQENRAFRTVLDLEMEQVESAADLAADDVILVDHNAPRGFQGSEGVNPYAVVDHHPGDGSGTEFTDVRTDYGACASIVAEYFRDLDATVVGPTDDQYPDDLALSPAVTTGLVYGIQSDTDNLTKGVSAAEFEACQYLYPGISEETLDRIANPQVDAEVLDVKAKAIVEREVDPPYAIADVGSVNNVDAIPQSADELVRLEGVTAVVVYGENDGTIHLSGRSRDDRVHMGNCLKAVADEIPMAGAGGHARMGGGQVQREHMEGIGPQQGMSKMQLKERLFEAMRGEL